MWGAIMRLLRGGPDPRIEATLEAERILQQAGEQADREARKRQEEAREQAQAERDQILADVRGARDDLQRAVDRLDRREATLDDRIRSLDDRDSKLNRDGQRLQQRGAALDQREAEHDQRLEEVSNLTRDEARTVLFDRVELEISDEAGRMVREAEQKAKGEAETRARKIIATAIQRVASEVTTESTVSVVQIPSDEMKGRIIGREGRNIRALEAALGCDLIHRRHAGCRHGLRLRPGPPRGWPAVTQPTGRGRPHPSHSHRGNRRQGTARCRSHHPRIG